MRELDYVQPKEKALSSHTNVVHYKSAESTVSGKRTKVHVLRFTGTTRERQLRCLGHVLRGDSLEKDCLLGMMEET